MDVETAPPEREERSTNGNEAFTKKYTGDRSLRYFLYRWIGHSKYFFRMRGQSWMTFMSIWGFLGETP